MGIAVFHSVEAFQAGLSSDLRPAVAIGNLDGVHLGHRRLLESALASSGLPGVLTFSPHPQEVLHPSSAGHRLTTDTEKFSLLQNLGMRFVLALPFDSHLAQLSPQAFFQTYLEEGLRAASAHVGFDFRFGRGRSGDVDLLRQCAEAAQMQVGVIPPVEAEGVRISSSAIRLLIQQGNVHKAAEWMGSAYQLTGKTVPGLGRGRDIGIPTANTEYPSEKIAPAFGVYATQVLWKGQVFPFIMNFGLRPTFGSAEKKPTLETHLLDFSGSLYGETLTVEFIDRIREERRFESEQALRSQIQADIALARSRKAIPR
jgi:riboflavin kinase/FMN adenylyltransferase